MAPKIVELTAGEHWICMCGHSKNGNFCDGSHKGSGVEPKRVLMNAAGKTAVCTCGKTKTDPVCDGSHK